MKIFTTKHIVQKITIVLIFLLLFNFIYPNYTHAGFGGVLWDPVQSLVVGLGDAIISTAQNLLLGIDNTIITIAQPGGWWSTALGWLAGILTVAGLVALQFIPVVGQFLTVGIIAAVGAGVVVGVVVSKAVLPDTLDLPIFALSPAEIFSNKIPFLDVNFISPKESYTYTDENGNEAEIVDSNGQPVHSSAYKLRDTISTWYVALRNFAIVGLLSVLVYIAIRILISSTAQDKAKYKQQVVDWIIAMCILLFMHYIMSFGNTLIETITTAIDTSNKVLTVDMDLSDFEMSDEVQAIVDVNTYDGITKWNTNFMGQARLMLQMESTSGDESATIMQQMGYTALYLVLVWYTIMFTFQYLKRLLYLAFLTIIAPLVALTYPIDKLHDGQAQGFNMWLKEYIFNLLLQPFHLLLYTVLIGSAMDLAKDNMLYAVAAMGFMLPAEKLLRKFFGFDKSTTAGAANGALAGALGMQAINTLKKRGGKGGGRGKEDAEKNPSLPARTRSVQDDSNLVSDAFGSGESTTPAMPPPPDAPGPDAPPDTPAQRMSEAYDENYGTDEWDPHESAAMAREANPNGQGVQYSNDEYAAQILRDSGYSDEEIAQMTGGSDQTGGSNPDPQSEPTPPIRTMDIPNLNSDSGQSAGASLPPPIVKTGKGRKIGRAVARTTGKYLKQQGKNLAIGAAKTTRKVVTQGIPAAALGFAGATMGLASEDYSNVLKWGAAGAGAGMVVGNNVSNMASKSHAKDMAQTLKEEYYGTDYEEHMNQKADKLFMKDKENISQYKQNFGDDYKRAMSAAIEYRNHGITDNAIIMKAMGSHGFGAEGQYDSKQRVALAKMANQSRSEKDIGELEKKLEKKVGKENANKITHRIREMHNLIQ